ncbi:DUF5959 family protein [Streptomyces sp. NPDC052051]|uniref:DUF5959 family protein n=1 Tax=Streptomyces sp. NPDC052051 TaxID=3154649 RepID=UPI00342D9FA8
MKPADWSRWKAEPGSRRSSTQGWKLLVHNDFVSGVHDTYVDPRDLAGWAHVLDEVAAGRNAVWREAARVAEIGIRLDWREEDRDRITVAIADMAGSTWETTSFTEPEAIAISRQPSGSSRRRSCAKYAPSGLMPASPTASPAAEHRPPPP